jgi:hypothetical protein
VNPDSGGKIRLSMSQFVPSYAISASQVVAGVGISKSRDSSYNNRGSSLTRFDRCITI